LYELHGTMESAIVREKRIKACKREWKLRLIEELNPYWNDLRPEIIGAGRVIDSQDAGSLPTQG
jgi:putative endonuclease